jgi:Kef-type K+ transport system membrane component KefB/nucleotide-binding universal stress UspA family protein
MLLYQSYDLTLPLQSPVLIFSLILFIILFAPLLLNKFKIPHLIGLIIAGAIIGPNGFNLMLRDSSIILFGTVGLLYIMFLAGLEIDLSEFRKNSRKSLVFGIYTFAIPMILGTLSSYYILNFPLISSILLASMYASHTLIAYPIISKLGVTKNRAVNVTIGGTLITDTAALLVLAAIAGMSTGTVDQNFWWRLSISVIVAGLIIMFVFPVIGRWFFKNYADNISQYIFVLALLFLGAFLAEMAGIEAIIGAFLAGLSLNKLIPSTSPLMNRVEFVGNALFIPFFLIGVGMLVDYRVFIKDFETIKVAGTMILFATTSKFIASWLAQKSFGYTVDERRLIFGLSNAQAAATLAAVLVGYNIILNKGDIETAAALGQVVEPVRLLSESVLNGTILMILVTCTIATFVAQKGAQNIALSEASGETMTTEEELGEKILIPINDPDMAEEMISLSLLVKSKINKTGIYALHVIDSNDYLVNTGKTKAKKILEKASKAASAADLLVHELVRHDVNTSNGITGVVMEHKISDLILGLHKEKGMSDNFLGSLTEGILTRCNTTTMIYKSAQPISTIKRHLVIIPDRAEKEIGFPFWLIKIWNLSRNTGAKFVFYGDEQTLQVIRDISIKHPIDCEFRKFDEWEEFLILSREIRQDDNLIVIMSRKDRPSFDLNMQRVPYYLNKYFENYNYILIYPKQFGVEDSYKVDFKNPSVLEPLERLDDLGKTLANIFRLK